MERAASMIFPTRSNRNLPKLACRLFALALLLMLVSACEVEREYHAVLLILDIAAGDAPSKLKSVAAEPSRKQLTLPAGGRTIAADLYLSDAKPGAGVLLLPGAAETGKDDPRLQAFAKSLARSGFAVVVPDLAGFRSLRVSSEDIVDVADAFAWLAARPDLAPEGRAGMVSFSYASGPAILAALQPQNAGKASFMMTVGGYCNLRDVLTFFTTGWYRDSGEWRHMEPNSYGKWVFVLSNINRLSDPRDRALFRLAAQRKLADLKAPLHDIAPRLSAEGKRVLDFVENRDRDQAALLMDRLPEQIRREILALDIARYDLSKLKADMILVHGYDDDIIPYTESVALSKRLPKRQAHLYLVHGLKHVNLKPRLVDKLRLWRAMSTLLQQQTDR
jgi:alpha-beta hydrolase superfamily lysophospholipase